MTVKVYRFDIAGAPALSGNTGAAISVLDACLVNGWALPAVSSVTRSGNTATVTLGSSHGLKHKTSITLAAADQSDYNGTFVVTPTTATEFTYTIANSPATPATGSITATVTPAGWAKAFSGTGLAAYRAATGLRHYLRVADLATTNVFRAIGYEDMTDISSGANPYPTEAQIAGGIYCIKSNQSSGTQKAWVMIASDTWFYLCNCSVATLEASVDYQYGMFFGEVDTQMPGDQFHSLLIGGNSTSTTNAQIGLLHVSSAALNSHYMARGVDQIVGSRQYSKTADTRGSLTAIGNSVVAPYPDVVTGGMLLSPVYVTEPTTRYTRGTMPRLYAPLHYLPREPGDTFTGNGLLAGRDFLLLDSGSNGNRCRLAFDITP